MSSSCFLYLKVIKDDDNCYKLTHSLTSTNNHLSTLATYFWSSWTVDNSQLFTPLHKGNKGPN